MSSLRKQFVRILFLVLSGSIALSHGMDQPGPHGGKIDMPGAFHTEVVIRDDGVQVYLLDMDFKNPSTVDSDVKIQGFDCQPRKDHFFCKGKKPKGGVLKIKATREKASGQEFNFEYPKKD